MRFNSASLAFRIPLIFGAVACTIAGLIADHLMRRHEGLDQDVDWTRHGEAAMDWLHVTGGELGSWFDELQEALDAL